MAVTGISSVNSRRNSSGFMTLLSSAACEWFLMFQMYVDAALSYLLTKFASYCELQTPCILCSRLDHIFGNEKPGYYRSLLCSNHREEISSIICCQIHDKLADVRGMCEECFMSVSMQNKRSLESYKLVVGKMGMEFERCGFQSPYSKKNFISHSLSTRICSCCEKPLRTKTNTQRLLQLTPAGYGASRANVRPPLPPVPRRSRLSNRDSLKRMRDKLSGSVTSPRSENSAESTLAHVGYAELMITTDFESEVPFSDDDDDGSSVSREKFYSNEYFLAQWGSEHLARAQNDRATPVKQIQQASSIRPSLLDGSVELDVNKSNDAKASSLDAFLRHGLGELNWEQPDPKPIPSALLELISLDHVPSSSNVVAGPFGVSTEKSKSDFLLSQTSSLHVLSDLISLDVLPLMSTANEIPMSNDADLTDVSDSVKADNAVMLPPTILSANHDELQRSDTSISEGVRMIQNSASLDSLDSGYESADMSSVSEFEAENIVDQLKRQVDYGRRCMSSLYKELEEERNASAIAANQAMAMITRLQQEKAALQMESLQYLRMTEEQAEYDMDELEKANDLLAEKEKEIQDLEEKLEFDRNNFLDESALENMPRETYYLKAAGNMRVGNYFGAGIKIDANVPYDSRLTQISKEFDKSIDIKSSFLDFEDEKMYITQRLKNIERKLRQVSSDFSSAGMPSGVCSEKTTNGVENSEGISTDRGTRIDHQNEKTGLSSTSKGCPSDHDGTFASVEDDYLVSEENNDHFDSNRQKSSRHSGEIDLGTLENEISELNERLEALVAEREYAFNWVGNGKESLQFVQDVGRQLHEVEESLV